MKRWIFIGLIVVFLAIFTVSALYLWDYFSESDKASDEYDALAGIMDEALQSQTQPTAAPTDPHTPGQIPEVEGSDPTEPQDPCVLVTDPETGETVRVLPEFAQLYTMNNDIVGWIRIPGTKVNYPVMQSPDEIDYYLKRSFYKNYSNYGAIYVKEECDVFAPSDNLTIYGHRMNDGSMFAALHGYKDQSFCLENPLVTCNTLTERHTYEVFSVFLIESSVNSDFMYHLFIDAHDQAEFDAFVTQCRERSLYDTGVEPQYGDKFITLSTCEYSNYHGRLVLVARRVD